MFLRVYKELSVKATLQCMIFFLTSDKTDAEKIPLSMEEKTTVERTSEINLTTQAESNINVQFSRPIIPKIIKINNFLELDIEAAKTKYPDIMTLP